ncbi:MAG: toll/interleukin-1 receptor domain-containing protein [Planctomycetes bacterium]|nr:toll/interleukin-1 receptor domain-containing protein [Planctomycetota bacterium]
MPRIFVSYRRQDSSFRTARLGDALVARFGQAQVFMDVDSIRAGDDFVGAIEREMSACEVVLAIIANDWLACADPSGRRRLDDPHDYVRLELAAALIQGKRVIPVLLQGARMPSMPDLPAPLAPLALRNAIDVGDEDWPEDVRRLLDAIATQVEPRENRGGPPIELGRKIREEPDEAAESSTGQEGVRSEPRRTVGKLKKFVRGLTLVFLVWLAMVAGGGLHEVSRSPWRFQDSASAQLTACGALGASVLLMTWLLWKWRPRR